MPMPPNVNAIYEEANATVRAAFAEALANKEWAAQSAPIIEELDVDDTKVDFNFLLDNFGFQPLKKNIEKKAAVEKQVTMFTTEWIDNLTVPTRDLTSRHGDKYRLQARIKGKAIPRWKDQQVAKLLKSTGAAFNTASFDGVPYFSAAHPMNLAGEDISAYSNLNSGGGGNYWYLFDTSLIPPVFLNWKARPDMQDLGPESEHAKKAFEVMWNIYADAGFGMALWFFGYASNQTLNEDNFDAARQAMQKVPTYAKSDTDSQYMGVNPTLLVVGSSNQLAAQKLILGDKVDNNIPNPLYRAVEVLTLTHLP